MALPRRELTPTELRTLAQQADPELLAKLGSQLLGLPGNRAAHVLGDALSTWVTVKANEVGAEQIAGLLLREGGAQLAGYLLRRLLAEGASVRELELVDQRSRPG